MRLHKRITRIAVVSSVAASILVAASPDAAPKPSLSVQEIVARSAAATQHDFKAYSDYSHTERDKQSGSDKTYRVMMILGSPYQELIAVNGKPISEQEQQEEKNKLDQEIRKRKAESPSDRQRRIDQYQRDRQRDNTLVQQLTAAFDFQFIRTGKLASFDVYVLKATPKKGYRPPNVDSEVLPGMEGTMWVDKKTFQWVKVTARVIHPVSIMGFLAQVQPGTRFELEKRPVTDDLWFPSHFSMHADAKILGLWSHNSWQDQTFTRYEPAKRY